MKSLPNRPYPDCDHPISESEFLNNKNNEKPWQETFYTWLLNLSK